MTSPPENHHQTPQPPPPGRRHDRGHSPDPSVRSLWRLLSILLVAAGLMAATTASVEAQPSMPSGEVLATQGTCADLGLSVVEPVSVTWEADFEPVVNPQYLWAYGDPDLLWDDAVDEYWYHWYDAVPGPDAYIVYNFPPGTVIGGVQFTNDWSSGDLQLQGLNSSGQNVSDLHEIDLSSPYVSYSAMLDSMTVSGVKMTTSTQQVKLLELDFCGDGDVPTLDLNVSSAVCETITADWTQQPGANHQITVVDGNGSLIDTQSGLAATYGPLSVSLGTYTVTLTATSSTGTITETATVTVSDCAAGCGAGNDPADAYCPSVNVIESFGDAPLPPGADAGVQWDSVRDYYNNYGNRSGMCSIDVHNSYWTAVRAADGQLTYYPSWHPPVHDEDGPNECRFTHEHGLKPTLSDLYDESHPTNIGVPFGFVHPGTGGTPGRVEDHVGHKVIVANNFKLTTSNPYHGSGFALNLFTINGQEVTCDWYSKLHQGTHGPDALGFNLHEYYLNYSCDDGTEVRVKEMTDFGFRTLAESDTPPNFPLTGGSGTVSADCGWFASNLPGPASDPDPSDDSDFGDAGRGFSCLMSDAKIEELWKPSAHISAPDHAGTVAYDPYYVVMNPNRYGLFEWWEYLDTDGDHVGDNAMISMVDFCVDGTEMRNELMRPAAPSNFVKLGWTLTGPFRVQTYCDAIDASAIDGWEADIISAGGDNATLMAERKESVDNTFIGTRRGVHTKGPVVYGRDPNFGSLALFCADHLGNQSEWPIDPNTGAPVTPDDPWSPGDATPVCLGGVTQILSTFFNNHGPVEGSTAGATFAGGSYISNGPASEITINMDLLYPNHGVQAPN